MEITQYTQTPNQLVPSTVRPASDFGMSNGGQSCFGVLADARTSWIDATGLSMAGGTDLRDRSELTVKGHVALAVYIPGHPAWSPPTC